VPYTVAACKLETQGAPVFLLPLQDNDWGITTYPLIAGHEVVGTITAKGANVEGLDIGQR